MGLVRSASMNTLIKYERYLYEFLLKYKKYLFTFFLVGIVIYFPIFFNGFAWDDFAYILNNPEVHQFNPFVLLANNRFNSGPFYRPIPAIYFAFLYSLFAQQAFFYHLLQFILHMVDTYLIFLFFLSFFADGIAFFLALLFLVHPINVESVAYIAAGTPSELYFLPGISALLLAQGKNVSRNKLLWITGLLLLSVMTKETGFLFILLLLIYRYLFKLNKLKQFFFSAGAIVIIYALLRVIIGGVTTYQMSEIMPVPIAELSLFQRILNIPAIIIYYLKTFLFPLHLAIWQHWVIKTLTLQNFLLPLLLSGSFFLVLLITFYLLDKKNDGKQPLPEIKPIEHKGKHEKNLPVIIAPKKSQQFLFFFLWFLFGIGLLLQIVPLDMTVADRWFYFPIVGLLGMLGVGLKALQTSASYEKQWRLYIWGAVFLVSIFCLRTFIRTFDWKDNITLYSHDVKEQTDNYLLLNEYGRELYLSGKIDEAIASESKSVALFPTIENLNTLGNCYQVKRQYKEAIALFTRAINVVEIKHYHGINSFPPYDNLALTLIQDQRPFEAINFIQEQAMKEFPENPELYTLLAVAESRVNRQQEALEAASRAYYLSPNPKTNYVYSQIKNNLPVIIPN